VIRSSVLCKNPEHQHSPNSGFYAGQMRRRHTIGHMNTGSSLQPDPLIKSIPLLRKWMKQWGIPGLASKARVTVNPRLRSSLARCIPSKREIELSATVLSSALLPEVLWHEAAHLVVQRLWGKTAKPHGAEWAKLMHAVGFKARVRLPGICIVPGRSPSVAQRSTYEHRCPVCQMIRMAKRPVRRWRCRICVEAGLKGELIISRRIKS